MPEREQLAERLPAVLEAVYGAYAIDWQLVPQGSAVESLSAESVHLALRSRRPAPRRARGARPGGAGVPVGGPSARPARRGRMHRAARGAGHRPLGSHHDRPRRGAADARARPRPARPIPVRGGDTVRPLQPCHARAGGRPRRCAPCIARWCGRPPSLGAEVALAALDGEIDGPAAGLRALDAVTDPAVERFQPALAVRAHLLAQAGRFDEAARSYRRAIDATSDPGVVEYLERRLRAVAG